MTVSAQEITTIEPAEQNSVADMIDSSAIRHNFREVGLLFIPHSESTSGRCLPETMKNIPVSFYFNYTTATITTDNGNASCFRFFIDYVIPAILGIKNYHDNKGFSVKPSGIKMSGFALKFFY